MFHHDVVEDFTIRGNVTVRAAIAFTEGALHRPCLGLPLNNVLTEVRPHVPKRFYEAALVRRVFGRDVVEGPRSPHQLLRTGSMTAVSPHP
jgi:hypothetical protein